MFKYVFLPVFFITTVNIAIAQTETPVSKQNVIDVLNLDLNDDGLPDRVVLYELKDGDAAVDFYTRTSGDYSMVHLATLTEPVWSTPMFGAIPSLDMNDVGSIQVKSGNFAYGRNRWEQTITIAYRNNALRVVGYTYNWYDTLDLKNTGKCDVNYLSGKASLKLGDAAKKWVDLSKPAQTVDVWSTDMIAGICYPD